MALLSDTPRIFWAGDSTVKQNDFTSYPQCGIGQGFSLFVRKEILIVNRAENGRSTKSFIDEGMQVDILTEEQLQAFKDAVAELTAELKADYGEDACAAFGIN